MSFLVLVPEHRIETAHHYIHLLLSNSLFKGYSAQILRGGKSTLGLNA